MSEPLEQITLSLSMSSQGGSHVKTYQSQGNAKDSRKATDRASGLNTTESFANYDPDTSSWRTCQACLLTVWTVFSETWPKSGTMRSGRCYRQRTWGHRTSDGESSLWPTPAQDSVSMRKNKYKQGGMPLTTAVMMWHTPTRGDSRGAGPNQHTATLGRDIKQKHGGQLNPTWVEWLMGFPPGWTDLNPSATP